MLFSQLGWRSCLFHEQTHVHTRNPSLGKSREYVLQCQGVMILDENKSRRQDQPTASCQLPAASCGVSQAQQLTHAASRHGLVCLASMVCLATVYSYKKIPCAVSLHRVQEKKANAATQPTASDPLPPQPAEVLFRNKRCAASLSRWRLFPPCPPDPSTTAMYSVFLLSSSSLTPRFEPLT